MKFSALSTLAVLVCVHPALAADLPHYDAGSHSAYASPMSRWGGAYLGLQGGVAWGKSDQSFAYQGLPVPTAGLLPTTNNLHGQFGGIHLGYNVARGGLVIGVEADAELSGVHGEWTLKNDKLAPGYSASSTNDIGLRGSLRLRGGAEISSGTLVYATGGFAVAEVKDTYSITVPAGNVFNVVGGTYSERFSAAKWGYTVGGGV